MASIKMNCGRHIYLEALFQYYTYGGLLEGAPTRSLNMKLVNDAQEYAKDKLWLRNQTPFLIQPIETPIVLPKGFRANQPAQIPAVVCLARFHSSEPAKHPENDCSDLGIVWFQDEFALPIDPTIEETIRGIDWNAVASDGNY